MLTYSKIYKGRNHFRNYIRMFEGRSQLSIDEILSGVKLETKEDIDISFTGLSNEQLKDRVTLYSTLFKLEK